MRKKATAPSLFKNGFEFIDNGITFRYSEVDNGFKVGQVNPPVLDSSAAAILGKLHSTVTPEYKEAYLDLVIGLHELILTAKELTQTIINERDSDAPPAPVVEEEIKKPNYV